ncbi:hypothetical protein Tco_1218577 [Tanacetum coccineum]
MLQEEIELARSLMDQKVCAYADRQPDNKRRMYNNSRDNNAQQLPYKRQNIARAYTVGPGEKKECLNKSEGSIKESEHGNQAGSSEARGKVYALGGGETDQDPNSIADDIGA